METNSSSGLEPELVELILFNSGFGGSSLSEKKNNNYEHGITLKASKKPVQVGGPESSVP